MDRRKWKQGLALAPVAALVAVAVAGAIWVTPSGLVPASSHEETKCVEDDTGSIKVCYHRYVNEIGYYCFAVTVNNFHRELWCLPLDP